MVIEQGDVVWLDFPPPTGSAPGGHRPAVVLQHDRYNRTRINTAVVIAITSNLKYAELPGNVRLRKGEAGLPCPSVINVTQIATVDRGDITGKLGRLTTQRLHEVWAGVRLVLDPTA
jgi:mRNA interferase MazF